MRERDNYPSPAANHEVDYLEMLGKKTASRRKALALAVGAPLSFAAYEILSNAERDKKDISKPDKDPNEP